MLIKHTELILPDDAVEDAADAAEAAAAPPSSESLLDSFSVRNAPFFLKSCR